MKKPGSSSNEDKRWKAKDERQKIKVGIYDVRITDVSKTLIVVNQILNFDIGFRIVRSSRLEASPRSLLSKNCTFIGKWFSYFYSLPLYPNIGVLKISNHHRILGALK